MSRMILITGGAGFVGSHLADELLRQGYRVRALDNLAPQVHGRARRRPDYLDGRVELQVGDVRVVAEVERALEGVSAVFHLAAAVGVGQSMYQVVDYTATNNLGTAVLLEALLKHPVERLVVASSMSVYGEGRYVRSDGTPIDHASREVAHLRNGVWEPIDHDGEALRPVATAENKPPDLSSIYALSKYDQERMCLLLGRAYNIPTVALRFFNIYGPRQALSNPYTGVLAIFASRLLNDRRPLIFEDGGQQRDFVSVHDVARACRLALEQEAAVDKVLNIGSGRSLTVTQIAAQVAQAVGKPHIEPEITGRYRMGDIRHCFADIARAAQVLGYRPEVELADGLAELAEWLRDQRAEDRAEEARRELEQRGLTL